jgi:acetolactate synthase II small subunit
MKHSLTIALKNQSIAVERFLRVVRHRGFDLTHFQLNTDEAQYTIAMTVDSDRPIHLLTSQLNKLVDAKKISLENLQQQAV